MYTVPTSQEIEELKVFMDPRCLTMYIPLTDDPLATADQNRIVMKNTLRDAECALAKVHVDARNIEKTLAPAHSLLKNMLFWPPRRASVALYLLPDFSRSYSLPGVSIPMQLKIKKGFEVRPLEDVLAQNTQYYVLALSHKHTQLYEGDGFRLEPIELDGVPTDMKTALGIDEYPKSLQTHTVAPASKQNNSEAFHEQYDVSHTDKDMLLAFFRLIDRSLQPLLSKKKLPLVIGGVEYLTSMYRGVNTYPKLLSKEITGNLDKQRPDTIRAAVWEILGAQK